MKKKVLSMELSICMMLAICMLLSIMPAISLPVNAAEDDVSPNFAITKTAGTDLTTPAGSYYVNEKVYPGSYDFDSLTYMQFYAVPSDIGDWHYTMYNIAGTEMCNSDFENGTEFFWIRKSASNSQALYCNSNSDGYVQLSSNAGEFHLISFVLQNADNPEDNIQCTDSFKIIGYKGNSAVDGAVQTVQAAYGNLVTVNLTGSSWYDIDQFRICPMHGDDVVYSFYFYVDDLVTGAPIIDVTAPTLSSYTPIDGAAGVAVNTPLALTFSEDVTAVSDKNITIVKASDNSTIQTIAVNDSTQVSISGKAVTISPLNSFDYNTQYSILIDSGAFKDTSGNIYSGIPDTAAWSFTTAAPDSGTRTVTYNWNYNGAPEPYTTQTVVTSGSRTAVPKMPARSGYTFGGWYLESSCATAWNFKNNTVMADTTLYAMWTTASSVNYTVTYSANGATSGSVPTDNAAYASGNTAAVTVTVKNNIGSLAKAGYTLGGWSYNGTTYTAGQTFNVSGDVTLTAVWIPAASTYAAIYSYNYTGGGTYATQAGITCGSILSAPSAPSRSGYAFVGWYKEAACASAWNFDLDTVISDTTLYAEWAGSTCTVSGTVKDDTKPVAAVVSGAAVKVMKGNVQFGDTVITAEDGSFTVTGIPNGAYNLVVTKDSQEVVICITVSGSNYLYTGYITLPAGNRNSRLEVIGSDTPNVVVDKLNDVFDDSSIYTATDSDSVKNGGTVEIKLTVQRNDSSANKATVEAAMTSEGYTAGTVLDVDLTKTATTSSGASDETPIIVTGDLITLIIPLPAELQGKAGYVVYRAHDYGSGVVVDAITTAVNNGEKIAISSDKTYLTLYVKYFSTYIIGYSNSSSSSLSSSGSSTASSYAISVTAGPGGSISPGGSVSGSVSVTKGKSQTFIITADEGYNISDVLVDGKSVGAVSSYTFTEVTEKHTIEAVFAKGTGLPYYLDNNGAKVFIGFASDAEGTMKYIAPKGETVLFRKNPKSFTDIAGHWGKACINFVTEREIFVGTGSNVFSPDTGMTRAMFAAVIGRLYERSYGELTASTKHTFTDVKYDAYYGDYIDWAAENKIIIGVGGRLFEPNREITRQEMAEILYRFAEFLGISGTNTEKTQLSYPDTPDISSWATEAALYCQQAGIITGRGGNFAPKATATRAEAASILQRFIEATTATKGTVPAV